MKNKLLIIDNYDSFTYNLMQIVGELHPDYLIIKNDEFSIEDIEPFSKILISPGAGVPSEAGLINEVISIYAPSKSILGVCLGHQAIASVFGAELFNFKQVCHGVAAKIKITSPNDYLYKDVPDGFEAGLYHSWAVSQKGLPECLRVTAVSSDNVIMSLAHN
ncbi:MAG: aminodeoxychorismate/anthranilate synthase component II, partial [Melioribacteraceae bacterium]